MKKKVIILIVVILLLIGGGIFWWWRDQAGARELNKNLPEGVRVIKNSFTGEYWADNRIDGFKVKIPREWEGLEKVEYFTEEEVNALAIQGIKGGLENYIAIANYKLISPDISLDLWMEEWIKKFGIFPRVKHNFKIGDLEVIKLTIEENYVQERLAGIMLLEYFFKKDSKVYQISGLLETKEFIHYIILNSKW
jgi:hypothetical protein